MSDFDFVWKGKETEGNVTKKCERRKEETDRKQPVLVILAVQSRKLTQRVTLCSGLPNNILHSECMPITHRASEKGRNWLLSKWHKPDSTLGEWSEHCPCVQSHTKVSLCPRDCVHSLHSYSITQNVSTKFKFSFLRNDQLQVEEICWPTKAICLSSVFCCDQKNGGLQYRGADIHHRREHHSIIGKARKGQKSFPGSSASK